jgi:Protein of unknown function (DUF2808)
MRQVYLGVAMTAASLLIGLGDGAIALDRQSVSFDHSPRLSHVEMTNRMAYFTVMIPQNAGEGLAKLSFSDRNTTEAPRLAFNLDKTQVFLGTPEAIGQTVNFADAWVDETGVVWVEFDPSLAPGTVFTVALAVGQNAPSDSREYGVAAYPESDNSVAAFVGDGMLMFK